MEGKSQSISRHMCTRPAAPFECKQVPLLRTTMHKHMGSSTQHLIYHDTHPGAGGINFTSFVTSLKKMERSAEKNLSPGGGTRQECVGATKACAWFSTEVQNCINTKYQSHYRPPATPPASTDTNTLAYRFGSVRVIFVLETYFAEVKSHEPTW